jgi:hypothetical protein
MNNDPAQQSMLLGLFNSLGLMYTVLLLLSGLVSFLLALLLVIRGKGPFLGVALFLIVHVPMLIGVYAAVEGVINMYSLISMSAGTPKPSEIAAGISTSLVSITVGMFLTIPGYAVAAIGSLVRALNTRGVTS